MTTLTATQTGPGSFVAEPRPISQFAILPTHEPIVSDYEFAYASKHKPGRMYVEYTCRGLGGYGRTAYNDHRKFVASSWVTNAPSGQYFATSREAQEWILAMAKAAGVIHHGVRISR